MHVCERKRRMEQFKEVLLSNVSVMDASESCFFSFQAHGKEEERGNLSLLNRELHSSL